MSLKYDFVGKKIAKDSALTCRKEGRRVCRWTILAIFIFLILVSLYFDLYDFTTESGEDTVPVPGWGFNTSRSTSLFISPNNSTVLLSNNQLCSEPFLLLIMVCSAPKHALKRKVIRQTWGNFSSPSYRVAFLLGVTEDSTVQKSIEKEATIHKDIIQENFIDSYNNLTIKSVMLLKYVYTQCNKVDYILKTDDDMFIHVQNLVTFLNKNFDRSVTNLLMGQLIRYGRPRRSPKSKWYSPKYMYQGKAYPKYLSGLGYLMDRKTAVLLYQAALTTPLLHLEDVYITGICAEKANVARLNHYGFSSDTRPLDPCLYKFDNDIFTSHGHSLGSMRELWSGLKNETFCSGMSWKYWSTLDLIKFLTIILILILLVCMSRIFSGANLASLNLLRRKRLF